MTESQVVNEWIRQGEARGELLQSRKVLIWVLEARFPSVVSAEVLEQIDKQKSQELLDEWFRVALNAFIPEHFLAVLRR
jgi:hypothetical protein